MIAEPSFYAAAIPAVILMGLSKGGFAGLGLLALPLMALVASPVQAAAIMLPILLVQDVVTVWAYRRTWSGRALVPSDARRVGRHPARHPPRRPRLGRRREARGRGHLDRLRRPPALARRARVASRRDPAGARRRLVLGRGLRLHQHDRPCRRAAFQIYLLPQRLPRDVFVGTGAVFFAAVNWIKVPPYILLGQFTPENLWTSTALFPVALASTLAGVWLVRRVAAERLYAIIYALLILVGLKLLVDGLAMLL
jgi:hypothetical protein